MYTIYVLKSLKDGNLYVGCTSNLQRRIAYHSSGKVKSTKGRLPMNLVYSELFRDRNDAYFTERFYKTAVGKRELMKKIKDS